jgi:hypothetical protein
MRKKTTKFYFFNDCQLNPATDMLFSFSKKAVKQRKNCLRIKHASKLFRSKIRRKEFIDHVFNYSKATTARTLINQWNRDLQNLRRYFLNSFFYRNHITRRRSFVYWFRLKNIYNNNFYKFIKNFNKTGVLSSHFVHVLILKNLLYQNRSKYYSKTFNLNTINAYVYSCAKILQAVRFNTYGQVYFFTANVSKKNLWTDELFDIQTSNWTGFLKNVFDTNVVEMHSMLYKQPINYRDYNCYIFNSIMDERVLIEQIFHESDSIKRSSLMQELTHKLGVAQLDVINFITFFTKRYNIILTDVMVGYLLKYHYHNYI